MVIRKETCPICGNRLDQPFEDKILKLFALWKNQRGEYLIISSGQREFAQNLIDEYSYENVKEAFIEACSSTDRMKLNYVRGILRIKAQKKKTEAEILEAKKKASEVKKIEEQKKIGGFDFSEITKKYKA